MADCGEETARVIVSFTFSQSLKSRLEPYAGGALEFEFGDGIDSFFFFLSFYFIFLINSICGLFLL